MTNKEQEDYWRKYAKQNAKMEKLAVYIMLLAFRRGYRDVIQSLQTVGVIETLAILDSLINRNLINDAYKKIYMQVGEKQKVWADRDVIIRLVKPKPILGSVAPSFGIGFENPQWLARLKQIVNNIDTIERVNSVRSTIAADMRRSISNSAQRNVSIRKITADLRKDFPDLSYRRAETIARTEVTYISNIAQEQSAMELGIDLKKVWIRTLDSRTRDTHVNAPRNPIDSDQPFIVGGKKMMRPGDPAGGIKEIINCRCVVSYVPADDYEDLLDDEGNFQSEPIGGANNIFY
jgi:hypothetical protein